MDLLIDCCRSAALFATLPSLQHSIETARKSYAGALRNTGKFALSAGQAREFEARAVQLEEAILAVERRFRAVLEATGRPGWGVRRSAPGR
jgi:hypothetical protein